MKSILDTREYYKPFTYPKAYEYYVLSEKMHWDPDEVPMANDVLDWKNKLTIDEKNFLTQIFRLFTQSDLDVSGAYVNNYLPLFQLPEIRMMLLSFAAREATHVRAYSHLIDTLGMPEITYRQFFEYTEMSEKHEYFGSFLADRIKNCHEKSVMLQIAAFSAFTEGMQLFSSFVMLLNFSRFNKMNGMGQIIGWSVIDESCHCEAMSWLFKEYVKEHREFWDDEIKSAIYECATKMVELENKFIDLAYNGCKIEGLDIDDLKQYIKYITDRRLIGLGMKGIFKVKSNPLPWVEEIINAPHHASFFETKNIAYSKAATTGSWSNVWK